jgi:hypothetical protein
MTSAPGWLKPGFQTAVDQIGGSEDIVSKVAGEHAP